MANNVKFLAGTSTDYNNIPQESRNAYTFYYTTNDNSLYLGNTKISNAADLTAAITRIDTLENKVGDTTLAAGEATNITTAVNSIYTSLTTLTGTGDGSIDSKIKAITGNPNDLSTQAKTNFVVAINELATKLGNVYTKSETDSAISGAVAKAVADAGHIKKEIVTTIPTDASTLKNNVIYMYKDPTVSEGDLYKEYMLIDGVVVQIGDTSINLTDYAKIGTDDDTATSDTIKGAKKYADAAVAAGALTWGTIGTTV